MPAGVVSISAHRQGTYVLLEAALPDRPVHTIGVLLMDPSTDRGYVRLRSHFDDLTDDTEVLDAVAADLEAKLGESGAERLLQSLEDSLSNTLRITGRQTIAVDAFTCTADRLFEAHVEKLERAPYRTHAPLWSLAAAAGGLGEDEVPEAEDWVRVPEGVRLSPDMFVCHVTGQSMEPLIPDGSLNLFRRNVVGSRQGKIVLIERFGALGGSARYSVKKYTSTKRATSPDEWEHGSITFVPLNPAFEPWSPDDPDEFRILAEWLRTIE
jgi:phage repressor protein C with HTH and peptisase S24 domain